MFTRRDDIPDPKWAHIAEAIMGTYVSRHGKQALRECSLRVPADMAREIRRFVARNGQEPLIGAIAKCLQPEAK